jgi:CheY-like chemotaxis protein
MPERVGGDGPRVRQIVLNLTSNAVKFTERGEIRLHTRHDGESLTVVVSDTGIGIPPTATARLFDPFFQVDPGDRLRSSGTGLGLTISRRLVEAMGGNLEFRSEVGVGSTFQFRIPAPVAPPPAATNGRNAPTQVLLADDDDAIREIMAHLLGTLDAAITTVGNGAEAVEQARHRRFDLVLLDLHMPVMDGHTAAAAIRSLPNGPRLVALSGAIDARETDRLRTVGFFDALTKPVSRARLRSLLDAVRRADPIPHDEAR